MPASHNFGPTRGVADLKYCFVFGCPRSGTTAVVRLLQAHPRVVIGMERHKFLLSRRRDRAKFGPALFEPERFFDFRPGDTNVNPDLGHFTGHYTKANVVSSTVRSSTSATRSCPTTTSSD
jgi:Sulfotransferase family